MLWIKSYISPLGLQAFFLVILEFRMTQILKGFIFFLVCIIFFLPTRAVTISEFYFTLSCSNEITMPVLYLWLLLNNNKVVNFIFSFVYFVFSLFLQNKSHPNYKCSEEEREFVTFVALKAKFEIGAKLTILSCA